MNGNGVMEAPRRMIFQDGRFSWTTSSVESIAEELIKRNLTDRASIPYDCLMKCGVKIQQGDAILHAFSNRSSHRAHLKCVNDQIRKSASTGVKPVETTKEAKSRAVEAKGVELILPNPSINDLLAGLSAEARLAYELGLREGLRMGHEKMLEFLMSSE